MRSALDSTVLAALIRAMRVVAAVLASFVGLAGLVLGRLLRSQRHARRIEQAAAAACPHEANDPLPWQSTVALVANETRLAIGDLGARRPRLPLTGGPEGGDEVLVLDGGIPSRAIRGLARRLVRDGRRVTLASLGDRRLPIEDRAAVLDGLLRSRTHDIDVVAYDVDGLAARVHVRAGRGGIRRLVTLGTPHQGTTPHPPRPEEQHPGGPLLDQLAHRDAVPSVVEATAIYGADDWVVVPSANGYWRGALNAEIRGVGHRGLLASSRVYGVLRDALGIAAPQSSHVAPARDAAP